MEWLVHTYSFSKYLLSTYYVPGTFWGHWRYTSEHKGEDSLPSWILHSKWDRKGTQKTMDIINKSCNTYKVTRVLSINQG